MMQPQHEHENRACQIARTARVEEVARPCREHVRVTCRVADFPPSHPGQFLQLSCAPQTGTFEPRELTWNDSSFPVLAAGDEFYQRQAFLRRPFSIADRFEGADGESRLTVISRSIGMGTAWLDQLRAGDMLDVTGPLGRGFRLPAADTPLVLVGGGVGIPPLLYLARTAGLAGCRDVTIIFGAMSADLLPVPLRGRPSPAGEPSACIELPGDAGYLGIVTTDDGSLGLPGRVTDGLRRWVGQRGGGAGGLVLACGPEAMLHAVADQTRELGLACQLCIEKLMGCGLGTCLSCVVRKVEPSRPTGWRWALSCSEGPVFDRDELLEFAVHGALARGKPAGAA